MILGTYTILYALRHLDDLLGIGGKCLIAPMSTANITAPEPLARLVGHFRDTQDAADIIVLSFILPRNIRQYRFRRWVCISHGHTPEMAQGYLQCPLFGILPRLGI